MRHKLLAISGRIASSLHWLGKIPGARSLYYVFVEVIWSRSKKVLDIEGFRMYLPEQPSHSMQVAFRSYLLFQKEHLTTQLFKNAVHEGNTVVDIGANIGYYSLLSSKLVGDKGKVYLIEPCSENYHAALNNVVKNGFKNVIPLQRAISDKNGQMKLYLSNSDIGAHTLRETHEHYQFAHDTGGEFEMVNVSTLDSLIKDRVNVIKMDCEGSEMAVILGAEHIIKNNPHLKMFIEFYPSAIQEMGYQPTELIRLLLQQGFNITVIDELRTPTNHYIQAKSIRDVMVLCQDKEKILNLYAER